MQRVSGLSFADVVRGTLPFLIPLLAVLALITVFPEIVLFLPRLLL
jgi:TRAP-type C4-dicarboxylate transport system permease large subunit